MFRNEGEKTRRFFFLNAKTTRARCETRAGLKDSFPVPFAAETRVDGVGWIGVVLDSVGEDEAQVRRDLLRRRVPACGVSPVSRVVCPTQSLPILEGSDLKERARVSWKKSHRDRV